MSATVAVLLGNDMGTRALSTVPVVVIDMDHIASLRGCYQNKLLQRVQVGVQAGAAPA